MQTDHNEAFGPKVPTDNIPNIPGTPMEQPEFISERFIQLSQTSLFNDSNHKRHSSDRTKTPTSDNSHARDYKEYDNSRRTSKQDIEVSLLKNNNNNLHI